MGGLEGVVWSLGRDSFPRLEGGGAGDGARLIVNQHGRHHCQLSLVSLRELSPSSPSPLKSKLKC